MPDLATLQQSIGHSFQNEEMLRLALTHSSIAHEQNASTPHNQRLEFLGDAVLGLVLSEQLYLKFGAADEGLLTKARARLVNARSLADHGRAINLGDYLILSRGEENTGGRTRPSILTDAYEALVGAIFLDGGFAAAQVFVLREFTADLKELILPAGIENPKGELQEILQARSPAAPVYQLISAVGPDHDRDFTCAVLHDGVELAQGMGKSKKAAESEAAEAALKKLREAGPKVPPEEDSVAI